MRPRSVVNGWRAAVPAILLFVFAVPLAAQVHGVVVDPAGHPLADVSVDLWSSSTRLARALTGPSGQFAFAAFPDARSIAARRVGSLPARVGLHEAQQDLRIVLAPAPLLVESIRVDGGSTDREDKAAVGRWRQVARRYRLLPDSLYLSSEVKLASERLPREQVGRPSLDSAGYGWTAFGHSTFLFRDMAARLQNAGWPAPDPESSWSSEPMWGAGMQYLVSEAFLAAYRLTMIDESTVRFCPRERRKPWVDGEARIGEDGGLLWARWRYGDPRFDPGTGSLAIFLAPAVDSSLPLLPSVELLWQERTSGMAAQRTRDYREWKVTATEPHWH